MRRHERTLAEKDSRNFVLKYEDFADGEITGEEQIYDFLQPSVEELALTNMLPQITTMYMRISRMCSSMR